MEQASLLSCSGRQQWASKGKWTTRPLLAEQDLLTNVGTQKPHTTAVIGIQLQEHGSWKIRGGLWPVLQLHMKAHCHRQFLLLSIVCGRTETT